MMIQIMIVLIWSSQEKLKLSWSKTLKKFRKDFSKFNGYKFNKGDNLGRNFKNQKSSSDICLMKKRRKEYENASWRP